MQLIFKYLTCIQDFKYNLIKSQTKEKILGRTKQVTCISFYKIHLQLQQRCLIFCLQIKADLIILEMPFIYKSYFQQILTIVLQFGQLNILNTVPNQDKQLQMISTLRIYNINKQQKKNSRYCHKSSLFIQKYNKKAIFFIKIYLYFYFNKIKKSQAQFSKLLIGIICLLKIAKVEQQRYKLLISLLQL
ncbi:hypothetical protein TTHERM_000821891 (macronuclear) [Tetrahymena thermophila SB210]|uniref:Uncharacterized protein n=1 Tax=Tetrahymena thermophila (strain SB210) TaxID=312017 RepID=W7XFD6_TETTS|nr:hypothetical protein TTHERM_000821891 [Tetrahymena thermophila SB210]EWS72711.1 hypothetical protein TTHERM_000821891 [Tetrahymena thermophila SB210]|eukprot:XP_012654753.1 hypothetical protein TTHERM_000821891 [Tetrahymena thermophila SB210]